MSKVGPITLPKQRTSPEPATPQRSGTLLSNTSSGVVFVGSNHVPNSEHEKKEDLAAFIAHKYNSIDFEEPDHHVLRLHYSKQTKLTAIGIDVGHYILSMILVVLISGLYLAMLYSTEYFAELRLEKIKHFWEEGKDGMATLFAVGTAMAIVVIPTSLVAFFAPHAIGSGMTEVIAFLNGASAMNGVTLKVLVIRYIGILGLVSAGLFSGIDGPLSEIGAGVGMILVQQFTRWSSFRKLLYGETLDLGLINDKSDVATELQANKGSDAVLDAAVTGTDKETQRNHKKLGDSLLGFLLSRNLRLFATIGAAVSIGVIFGAPVGGVLFAVEEATSFFELSLLIKLTFATIVGYLIVAFTHYDIYAKLPISNVLLNPVKAALIPLNSECNFEMRMPMVLTYIAMGVIGGLFGQLLNVVLSRIQKTRQRYLIDPEFHRRGENKKPVNKKLNALLRVGETLVIAAITALVVCWVPTGKDVDQCTSYDRPLVHISDVRSECDFYNPANPLTCENLLHCKEAIAHNGICYPTDTEFEFNNFVVETYQEYCAVKGVEADSGHSNSGNSEADAAETRILLTNTSDLKLPSSVNSWPSCQTPTLPQITMSSSLTQKLPFLVLDFSGTPAQDASLAWCYKIWEIKSLAVFFFVYLVMSCATYYIALPTDLVVPNLIIGAAAGRMLGLAINLIKPGYVDPGAYGLLGMASLWSGTSGLVLTVIAVALELTGDISYLPAIIIVCFTAAWVSSSIGPSLYHAEMENNGAPYLPSEPNRLLRTLTAKQIMTKKTVAIGSVESLRNIQSLLNTNPFEGYPVVQKYEVGTGESAREIRARGASFHNTTETKYRPIGYVSRDRLEELLEEMQRENFDLDSTVDIEAIVGSNPLTVRQDSTASKVYTLFRQLGLKRVFVVDESGFLVGIVARLDLIRPVLEEEEREEREAEERWQEPTDLVELARAIRIRSGFQKRED
ncbi:Clc chloride channel [Rhizoclosmatium globosum]|uniref:Chloride channel protein n=1 Tax=Rhizoclosmatium globosum TaxID=329046 RepID=A0A1Y2CXJ4_9FUNG|nr:Clc chloride channel [Rhizoclosmatium globosum]|eukprot:ORY51055.1 Clc chloride channel [Rhizoclosmatium globosum]